MLSKIKITNNTKKPIVIDIEGVIGVNEECQFQEPEERVATYEKFRSKVAKIKEINAKEVIVNIRSAGGNINDAILIYEALKQLSAKITTRCYGYVASAATIIAQAASENRREISSSALYLIHNSIGNIEGNSEEMKQTLNLLEVTDKTIAEIYATRSSEKIEIYSELMEQNGGRGRWLSPQETLDYGLVDKITVAQTTVVNNTEIVEVLGLPSIPKVENSEELSVMKKINRKWREIAQLLNITTKKNHINQKQPTTNSTTQTKHVSVVTDEVAAAEMGKKIRASKQTETKTKEDPSIEERYDTPNENAYSSDIEQFKI